MPKTVKYSRTFGYLDYLLLSPKYNFRFNKLKKFSEVTKRYLQSLVIWVLFPEPQRTILRWPHISFSQMTGTSLRHY